MMARLAISLLIAVIFSGLYVVQKQYESRQLFTQLDRALREAQQYSAEHERLEVEKRAAATSLRVEQIARGQLTMRPISPAITEYVTVRSVIQTGASGANARAMAADTNENNQNNHKNPRAGVQAKAKAKSREPS
jgi:cell division protein FtsL